MYEDDVDLCVGRGIDFRDLEAFDVVELDSGALPDRQPRLAYPDIEPGKRDGRGVCLTILELCSAARLVLEGAGQGRFLYQSIQTLQIVLHNSGKYEEMQ